MAVKEAMLYYNNMVPRRVLPRQMTHHHHHPEHVHPSPKLSPSLLRLSVPERLAVAGMLIVLLWLSALWAMGWLP